MKTKNVIALAAIGIAALSLNPAHAGGVHVSIGLPLPPIPFVTVPAPCRPPVTYAPAQVVYVAPPMVYVPAPGVCAPPPVYYPDPWGSRCYGYSHYTYGPQGWNGHGALARGHHR